jgi:hypothetical protein
MDREKAGSSAEIGGWGLFPLPFEDGTIGDDVVDLFKDE